MGKFILKTIGVVLGILFLPFVLTLLLSRTSSNTSNQEVAKQLKTDGLVELSAVGDQTMDEYIMTVLAAYVPLELQMDTMKAMAVIIRTNVYKTRKQLLEEGKAQEDLTPEAVGLPVTSLDSIKQKYGEEKAATYISTLENVVYSTKNQIMTYQEQPIVACYHYANAGKTRDYEESTGKHLPYLISVDSSQDVEASVGITTLKITFAEAATMLEQSFEVGKLDSEKLLEQLSIEKQDSTGYVETVKVGAKTISGEDFKRCFFLNSTNFYFSEYEGNLRIICKGKGSGFGLSQYGADVLAKQGQTYDQLLSYYYPGVNLITISE